ncbi:MAG: hypothetical protein A3H98_09035 [Bacteroidetes bacterium RIFCSPLOWO2_02_FULL_36_8]|nr:MAG: hypothetical protein A3H98_09035 [Bacteroidetes bacterium RIFCSPLOWO2_02_FULL_36_8]
MLIWYYKCFFSHFGIELVHFGIKGGVRCEIFYLKRNYYICNPINKYILTFNLVIFLKPKHP